MEIGIITLGVIVLVQVVERYLFAKQVHKQLENANKAVMSRNIDEYLNATKKEDKKSTEAPPDSDEVLLSEASDEEFNKHIKNLTK